LVAVVGVEMRPDALAITEDESNVLTCAIGLALTPGAHPVRLSIFVTEGIANIDISPKEARLAARKLLELADWCDQ
jgi:hypothetical protein